MGNVLSITKEFRFEAAHQLPYHNGKCARLHGHSYRVQVTVTGEVTPDDAGESDSGMVMDFYEISSVMKPVIDEILDHHSLNEILDNPTAENLVLYLCEVLIEGEGLPVTHIRVYETESAWVDWFSEEYSGART